MNSKRAKQLRRLSKEHGIAYEPLKVLYNTLGRQSEQENKVYANQYNTPLEKQATTSGSDSKEVVK